MMTEAVLQEREFSQFQRLLHQRAGISLSPGKKALVAGRLAKRLKHHGLGSYGEYYELLSREQGELQVALDLLTTNETYFFREPRHFDLLRDRILPGRDRRRPFRVWSAASSSGEEAYSLAMVLDDVLGHAQWEVLGSDLSTRVLETARAGLYRQERIDHIPPDYLRRYCLKGIGARAGTLLVDPALRRRVAFRQVNLNETLPDLGEFDVIFLRNVMIYFQPETKRQVVARLAQRLRPGGWLIIGHSESLNGLADGLVMQQPSVYRKPSGAA